MLVWLLIGAIVIISLYFIIVIHNFWNAKSAIEALEDEEWREERLSEIDELTGMKNQIIDLDFIKSEDSGEDRDYYHFTVLRRKPSGETIISAFRGYPPSPFGIISRWEYEEGKNPDL